MSNYTCEHKSSIQRLDKTVFGNGDPENSLLVRVSNIDKHIQQISRRQARIEKIGYTIIAAVAFTLLSQITSMIRLVPHDSSSLLSHVSLSAFIDTKEVSE